MMVEQFEIFRAWATSPSFEEALGFLMIVSWPFAFVAFSYLWHKDRKAGKNDADTCLALAFGWPIFVYLGVAAIPFVIVATPFGLLYLIMRKISDKIKPQKES